MALACARCGTQNPDGNAYCQACGAALSAPVSAPMAGPPPGVPPPGPPAGMAPPTFGAGGYASPYYAPVGPTPPVHRTPWMVIIAGVVALVVLMAGCGTALAVIGSRTSVSVSGTVGDLPSPTPATSPSPVASPTTVPTGPSAVSNDGVSLTLPLGWTVEDKDNEEIVVMDPDTQGDVEVASGTQSPAATAQENLTELTNELKNKYPDTRTCSGTKASNTTFSGARGISSTICFTLTSGTQSLPAAASIFIGANGSGSVFYLVLVLTSQSNLTHYLTVAKPVLSSVHWKLS
jgi:hypothetical protein